jgi:hypothetical protein
VTNFTTFKKLSLDSCGFVDVRRPLWRDCWCWALPAQCFSGPSPAGLMTVFYSLSMRLPHLEGQVPLLFPESQSQVQVTLLPTVSRPVRLGVVPLLERVTRCYSSLSVNYFFYFFSHKAPSRRGRHREHCLLFSYCCKHDLLPSEACSAVAFLVVGKQRPL